MTQDQVVMAVAFVFGIPALAFLSKLFLQGTLADIKQATAELREVAKMVGAHETQLALHAMRIGGLESELGRLRAKMEA